MEAQRQLISEEDLRRQREAKRAALCAELERQRIEACGPLNKWFAGERLGHSPTDEEAMLYYDENGGAKGFRDRMRDNPPPPSVMADHEASIEPANPTTTSGT